jgi:hypothetical protein
VQTLSIKNWDSFQQYKDRDPKWIKLHREILNDYEFDQLTEVQQAHLMKIWLLASKLDNKIPNDPTWIARQIGAKSKVDIKQLVTSGFIVAYKSVQECTETYLETETETETETEERETKPRKKRAAQLSADWEMPEDFKEYCVTKRPELKPEVVAENFKDYYLSIGKPMVDWKRTWQRWVRNERVPTTTSNGYQAPEVFSQSHQPATFNRDLENSLDSTDPYASMKGR